MKINDGTMHNLSQQLSDKYPFLKAQSEHLNSIFKSWLFDGRSGINNSADYLVDLIKKNSTSNDIGEILQIALNKCDLCLELEPILQKYQIYHKYQLTDFAVIKFAADFYGKSIEELANDALEICNFDSPSAIKIKNQYVKNQLKHLIACDILVILGILFFHLKIATIIEDIYKTAQESLSKKIISKIIKNVSFDHDIIKNRIVNKHIHFLNEKYGADPEYYDGFAIDRLKQVYDIYLQPFENFKSLGETDMEKYISQFPESSVIIKDKKAFNDRSDIINTYYYLVPIFYQYQNLMGLDSEPNTKYFIKPKIFDIDKNKLLIEI
jgi:hypothetical protein